MKVYLRIIVSSLIATSLLIGCLWLLSTARASTPTSLPSVSASQFTELEAILLDDFADDDGKNELGGNTGCSAVGPAEIACPVEDQGNDGFLELAYDVTEPSTSAVYTSELLSLNMTALDAVWVAIKGAQGSEAVKIGFEDCNQTRGSKLVGDYLGQGIVTSDYSAVAIPLAEFSEIADWSCVKEFRIIVDSESSSGQGTIYVDEIWFLPAVVLVDDFPDDEIENELGGPSGPWTTDLVSVTTAFTNGALKLSYDVPAEKEYEGGGYWTKLLDTNLLSWKDYLFFDVRGEQGGEEIAAEFIDCSTDENTNSPDIKVSDYLEGGITTGWHTVAIPLAAFVEVGGSDGPMDWNCIYQLAFNVSSQPEYNSGKGTVYIDNVRVVPTSVLACRPPLLVDRFHDCNDRNALNWRWYTGTWEGAEFDAVTDPLNRRGDYGCGYRLTYNVGAGQGGATWTELKGLDVSDYSYLEFYIKGKEGNVGDTRVFLGDLWTQVFTTQESTTSWRRVMIPLIDFAPVQITDLTELKFAYEGGFRQGEVYVDEIRFVEQPCISMLPVVFKDACLDRKPGCRSPFRSSYEPNNYRCSTVFRLSSEEPIQSYICSEDDSDDYYYIDVTHPDPISVALTDIPIDVDYDLHLYYGDEWVAGSDNDGNADEVIKYSPSETGRYYIRVYQFKGHSESPYTLSAIYQ